MTFSVKFLAGDDLSKLKSVGIEDEFVVSDLIPLGSYEEILKARKSLPSFTINKLDQFVSTFYPSSETHE